ncbi:HAD-IA family hydrolase [Pseudomonas taiwanensis]|uniref:HAD family hydrolase n=1 Tax=Pseudomonas taiwanensis TaxID=470150 RepID=UPI0028DFD350|nr:HAD-IA family hydrolase [Pseudomonas taiwanensis]MDT8924715.1 HAD-IA family hydrolase [Pseudomonas taiwanensis]
MKAIILDGYGTLVQISRKRYPYRHIENLDRMSKHSFYGYVLTRDLSHEQVLAAYRVPEALAKRSIVKMQKELASVQPYPEALEFLRHLDAQGIAWRILSNLATPYCKALTDALGITDERCFFSCREGLLKPESGFFDLAARSLGLPANEILMVGDAKRADVEGALHAGMHAFHLQRPAMDLWQALDHFQALSRIKPLADFHASSLSR